MPVVHLSKTSQTREVGYLKMCYLRALMPPTGRPLAAEDVLSCRESRGYSRTRMACAAIACGKKGATAAATGEQCGLDGSCAGPGIAPASRVGIAAGPRDGHDLLLYRLP